MLKKSLIVYTLILSLIAGSVYAKTANKKER